MASKDVVTFALAVLTLTLSGILYWRENKKLFQERIFEHKFSAYKEILEEIGMFYEDVEQFLEFFQSYEKSLKEWRVDAKPYFVEYFPKAYALRRLYYKSLLLLPESQLIKLDDLLGKCVRHVTNHHHFKAEIIIESHDELYDLLMDFAEEARKDLSINVLNVTLNKRLAQALYPIQLPTKKSVKDVEPTEYEDDQVP